MIHAGKKILVFIALLVSASLSMADAAIPPLKARVTDLTGTLSTNEATQLEQKLAAFEARKGSQIAVLIVPTTQPETIEQYSIRVVDAWKLGRKGIDDGVLLLVAKQDRTVRVEVGYGLEGVLPDAVAKRITDEIIVPESAAVDLWNRLIGAGVAPAGLGARDTLRLEAGMNLYGQDMDESITPWEAGLAWTVALDEGREFIGRAALEKQKAAGVRRIMVGLVMDEKGVLRHGQRVATPHGDGEILSGTFSPTLGKAIAFARVPAGTVDRAEVDIRGKLVPVRVVKFPFVRDGKACVV